MYNKHLTDFNVAVEKFLSDSDCTLELVNEHIIFERYLLEIGFTVDCLTFSKGEYDSQPIQGIWIAWQACSIRSWRVTQLEQEVQSLKRQIQCMTN